MKLENCDLSFGIGDFIFVSDGWLAKQRHTLRNHYQDNEMRPYLVVGFAEDNPDIVIAVPLTSQVETGVDYVRTALQTGEIDSMVPSDVFVTTTRYIRGRQIERDGVLCPRGAVAVPRIEGCCTLYEKASDMKLDPYLAPSGNRFRTKETLSYARERYNNIRSLPEYVRPSIIRKPGFYTQIKEASLNRSARKYSTETNLQLYIQLAKERLYQFRQKGI